MPEGRELVVGIVVLRLGVVRRIPLVIVDLILYLLLDLRMVLKAQHAEGDCGRWGGAAATSPRCLDEFGWTAEQSRQLRLRGRSPIE